MNIFYIDLDPVQAAKGLCDQHVTKMLMEGAQLLASVHHLHGSVIPDGFPKLTHRNHPCSVWTRSSIRHYRWLALHTVALCDEFQARFGHPHSWADIARWMIRNEPHVPDLGFTEPPQAMPSDMMVDGDAVTGYRKYYKLVKSSFARWNHSTPPSWW